MQRIFFIIFYFLHSKKKSQRDPTNFRGTFRVLINAVRFISKLEYRYKVSFIRKISSPPKDLHKHLKSIKSHKDARALVHLPKDQRLPSQWSLSTWQLQLQSSQVPSRKFRKIAARSQGLTPSSWRQMSLYQMPNDAINPEHARVSRNGESKKKNWDSASITKRTTNNRAC